MTAEAEAASRLRRRMGGNARIAIALGSGLSAIETDVDDPIVVRFSELPGLPETGVMGHEGRFVGGRLGGVPVLLQAGRYHVYEGHPMSVVGAPMRILAAAGVTTVVTTNAVGGIHPALNAGDIVLLDDQLNVSFRGPLAGPVVRDEARFPDMSEPFDAGLQRLVLLISRELGIEVRRGTYAGVPGPSYETAAEIRMIARLGGDVVGMSTVPEVIVAAAVGLRLVGLSLVTNKATGLSNATLSHGDVLSVGRAAGARLGGLVTELVRRIDGDPSAKPGQSLETGGSVEAK